MDLDDSMDNFFNTLYQKMFTVLNSQYNFDNKYLECVSEHMKEMRPFGDVPQKLSVQVKRSFVATRAFSQALTIAANVLKNMQTVMVYWSIEIARSDYTLQFNTANLTNLLINFQTDFIKNILPNLHSTFNLMVKTLNFPKTLILNFKRELISIYFTSASI